MRHLTCIAVELKSPPLLIVLKKLPYNCLHVANSSNLSMHQLIIQLNIWFNLTIGFGLKNYPKMMPHMPNFVQKCQSYGEIWILISWFVQLISPLDLAWKTTPKWPLICPILYRNGEICTFISWFVQLYSWFDFPYSWATWNCHKLTPHMLIWMLMFHFTKPNPTKPNQISWHFILP